MIEMSTAIVKEYGYEYDALLDEKLWCETKGKTTNQRFTDALCLRSGRDALKAIAREFDSCEVWLPALACDSMVHPFEQYGHKVKYYRLNTDYSIDLDSIQIDSECTLFLYMHYFGCTAIGDYDLEKMRERGNIIFIEDRTHNLIWDRKSTFQPDYIMASLRKWIPIPDGGLLWGTISKPLATDTTFSTARLKAQCMRHEFLACGDEAIKTEYRKIFSTVSAIMDQDEPSGMSEYSYALANATDWNNIKAIRRRNADALISVLKSSPLITFIQNKSGLSDLYVAFTVPNRDEIQRRLSSMGIFNTIIWPLKDEQKSECVVAKKTEEQMLAAPCDQRYTASDMEYIGTEIVRVIEDVNR